jgi:FkbM family methyltransferase
MSRVTVLRRVTKSRLGQHLIQTVRGARVVDEPLRFVALQLGTRRTAGYRLRDSGLRIFLRHQTRDVHILNEIFGGTAGRNSYEPPGAVVSELDASASPTVLDLGANIGLFGAYVLSRWPRAVIHSFEPDPANVGMLTRTIVANRLQRRWSVADVAVTNQDGEMAFASGLCADSHLVYGSPALKSSQTIMVSTVDFFTQDHGVDLVKMDIEGGEWAILDDSRMAGLGADVLVIEWHARGCPDPDPHAATIRLLRAAGYRWLEEVEWGKDNGLLWARRETSRVI